MVPKHLLVCLSLLVLLLVRVEAWPKPNEGEDASEDETQAEDASEDETEAEDETNDIAETFVIDFPNELGKMQFYPMGPMDEEENYEEENDEEEAEVPSSSQDAVDLPDSFSAVDKGWVTPVKFSGDCGASGVFASVAVLEVCFARITNQTVSYSEQQIIDCARQYDPFIGCYKARPWPVFKWAKEVNNVLAQESDYPYVYKSKKTICLAEDIVIHTPKAIATGLISKEGTEDDLKRIVFRNGAAAASLSFSKKTLDRLASYESGIFHCTAEDQQNAIIQHAVAVVGYGRENDEDFWLLKNSWSYEHGEQGYIRLARGKGDCGIGKHTTSVACGLVDELCPDLSCLKGTLGFRNDRVLQLRSEKDLFKGSDDD